MVCDMAWFGDTSQNHVFESTNIHCIDNRNGCEKYVHLAALENVQDGYLQAPCLKDHNSLINNSGHLSELWNFIKSYRPSWSWRPVSPTFICTH